ncbi:MAG: hypothetical protein ACYTFI_23160 [Planctomycetota bacterium]|jgi:hypothetical protein
MRDRQGGPGSAYVTPRSASLQSAVKVLDAAAEGDGAADEKLGRSRLGPHRGVIS